MADAKYYPSPTIVFIDSPHPLSFFQGVHYGLALLEDLKGLESIDFNGKDGFIVRIDETLGKLVVTNTIDGGTF